MDLQPNLDITSNSSVILLWVGVSERKGMIQTTLALIILFTLTACASPPKGAIVIDDPSELPSIQAVNAPLLSKLEVGMALSGFKKLVPDAYPAGQAQQTIAYELMHIQKYVTKYKLDQHKRHWQDDPKAHIHKQVLWFYFYKERLIQWGEPGDWPERPDLILEKRLR